MNGIHLTADCHACACDAALLRDTTRLRQTVVDATLAAGLTIVDEKFHAFAAPDGSPAGVTGALLLAESHVAFHTWPERMAVTLDVYVCNFSEDNTNKAQQLFDCLIAAFGPAQLDTHRIRRGESAQITLEYLTPHTIYGTRLGTPVAARTTPFQTIAIADSPDYGRVLRIDDAYMTSERDEFFYHECLVHPAAIAHPAPRNVLVIGGGDGGSCEELLKHPSVERITLCEIDPAVVELSRAHLQGIHRGALDDTRVTHTATDGFAFIAGTNERYDLILLDLTDPVSPAGNALAADCYRHEFFHACRQALTAQGALVMHLGSPFHHAQRFTGLARRLRETFAIVRPYTVHVPLYGALWGMAVASNSLDPAALASDAIRQQLSQRGIGDLQYYNAAIHQALFALPNFVQNLLR